MNSSLIGKIEKARRYVDERDERISFEDFSVAFKGDNGGHHVRFKDGAFACDCSFFVGWGTCSHTMALERILGGMISETPQKAHA